MNSVEGTVLNYEFKADLNAYLSKLGPTRSRTRLAELIAFNDAHETEEMPFFGQEIFLEAEKRGPAHGSRVRPGAGRACTEASRAKGIDAAHGGAPAGRHRVAHDRARPGSPTW